MFSIIIPLYNKEPHIQRALGSVLGQTTQDFEIIVINGGSIDKSADIVKIFKDPRIRLINQKMRGFQQHAIERLMEQNLNLYPF